MIVEIRLVEVLPITVSLALAAVVIWLVLRAAGSGAERLDRAGYWDRRIAKRGKRHHGPIDLPCSKVAPRDGPRAS
jgi:hypothetical protein